MNLYGIGSLLLGHQNAVVWGSGFISADNLYKLRIFGFFYKLLYRTDVRAVRGPVSLEVLKAMRIVTPNQKKVQFGDPAVLIPLIYPKKLTHKKKYVVIPHCSKISQYSQFECIGTFQKDWRCFIDRMVEADLVISSSLHGIILAESYGIPAVLLKDIPMNDFTKYNDWYYSTKRFTYPLATSVQEALTIQPSFLDRKVLIDLQNGLMECFPVDLWK